MNDQREHERGTIWEQIATAVMSPIREIDRLIEQHQECGLELDRIFACEEVGMYEITGKTDGGCLMVLDRTDGGQRAAKRLVRQYQEAFGPTWTVAWRFTQAEVTT